MPGKRNANVPRHAPLLPPPQPARRPPANPFPRRAANRRTRRPRPTRHDLPRSSPTVGKAVGLTATPRRSVRPMPSVGEAPRDGRRGALVCGAEGLANRLISIGIRGAGRMGVLELCCSNCALPIREPGDAEKIRNKPLLCLRSGELPKLLCALEPPDIRGDGRLAELVAPAWTGRSDHPCRRIAFLRTDSSVSSACVLASSTRCLTSFGSPLKRCESAGGRRSESQPWWSAPPGVRRVTCGRQGPQRSRRGATGRCKGRPEHRTRALQAPRRPDAEQGGQNDAEVARRHPLAARPSRSPAPLPPCLVPVRVGDRLLSCRVLWPARSRRRNWGTHVVNRIAGDVDRGPGRALASWMAGSTD